ncbi:MAG: hypothetical protein ACFFBP_11840 [Promethearchaeota archaeon]
MITIQSHAIDSKVIQDIKDHQIIHHDRYYRWIPAGSGNFEKTQKDGRYRENCNTYRGVMTCENHKIDSLKLMFNHCNKLDCETCFIHASSDRARLLNEQLLEFQREARKHGIKTGNVMHVVFSPKKSLALQNMREYSEFLEFRKEEIFPMLKDSGLFAGIIFTQLWSYKCQRCGKEEDTCSCQEQALERKLNPHFHVLGFGYLEDTETFREKHKDWIYVNLDRRKDAYHSIFYILTNVALWRKTSGKLKPAYQSFGYLRASKFVLSDIKITFFSDKCPICKKPRKKIIKGVETREIPGSHNGGRKDLIKNREDKYISLHVSEREIKLGTEIKYKRIVREYKILNLEGLREATLKNKIRFRKDRDRRERNLEEGSEYG